MICIICRDNTFLSLFKKNNDSNKKSPKFPLHIKVYQKINEENIYFDAMFWPEKNQQNYFYSI